MFEVVKIYIASFTDTNRQHCGKSSMRISHQPRVCKKQSGLSSLACKDVLIPDSIVARDGVDCQHKNE